MSIPKLKPKCKNCTHFSLGVDSGKEGYCSVIYPVKIPQWLQNSGFITDQGKAHVDMGYGTECNTFDSRDFIGFFTHEHRWLSNFHECEIYYEGIIYPTTEHAYQAAKSLDPSIRSKVARLATPAEAKKYSRTMVVRDDWKEVNMKIMYDLNYYKFTMYKDLKDKLLETGNMQLEEGNWWGDTFWGICDGKGENHLGKILMQVRKDIVMNDLKNVLATQDKRIGSDYGNDLSKLFPI